MESFLTTQDFFVSAINDRRDPEKFPYTYENTEPKIKDQINNDNRFLDEKKEELLTQYNLLQNPKKTSNEKQQPSHKSVLLRINNEHRAEKNSSRNSKRSASGNKSRSRSSSSESSSSSSRHSHSHHKRKKKNSSHGSNSRKKSHRISKKQSSYYSFSRKKSPKEEYEKYLVSDNNRSSGGGHYERQLLKKYKGEKLAEFLEKVSSVNKPSKEYPNHRNYLYFFVFFLVVFFLVVFFGKFFV